MLLNNGKFSSERGTMIRRNKIAQANIPQCVTKVFFFFKQANSKYRVSLYKPGWKFKMPNRMKLLKKSWVAFFVF